MGDPELLAGNLALDVLRAHLPAIERAKTVAEARAALAQPIAEAREVLVRMTGRADTEALERHLDELLARLVVLRRPRIDRNGRIYDAGDAGGPGHIRPIVAVAVGVAVVLATVALVLLAR